MRLLGVTLQAPAHAIAALDDFYGEVLGLPRGSDGLEDEPAAGVGFRIGLSTLGFIPAPEGDAPFYHYALLVPGDRFTAALSWARERVELLLIEDSDDVVMRFENWQADSCYFHDPVGNIVELIAHAPTGVRGASGPFSSAELNGLSEIGFVGGAHRAATALAEAGLAIFSGDVSWLAFVGEPTAALILSAEHRGWLPRGRPAEAWPATVRVLTPDGRELRLIHRPLDAVEQYFEIRESGDLPVADDLHPEPLGDPPGTQVRGGDD